jgi:hypothetical protein
MMRPKPDLGQQRRLLDVLRTAPQPAPQVLPEWVGWIGWGTWCLLLSVWTVGLLIPDPRVGIVGDAIGVPMELTPEEHFTVAKTCHVFFYALLVGALPWLPGTPSLRWGVVAMLALHAPGTEFLQTFVPGRVGSVHDVLLDLLGLLLGLLTWLWRSRTSRAVPASRRRVA